MRYLKTIVSYLALKFTNFKKKDKARIFRKYLKILLWPLLGIIAPFAVLLSILLPRQVMIALANAIGHAWYKVSPTSRQRGLENLDLIYGSDLSSVEKQHIVRASIQNILRAVLDYCYFLNHPGEISRRVLIADQDRLRLAQLSQTGGVVLSAHLGNWELLLSLLAKEAPINVLARAQKHFDHVVVTARAKHGIKTVHDSSAEVKELSGRLNKGELTFCILDRNVSHAKGVVVDFMGQPAFTPYFPVNLAYWGQVPVVPAFLIEEGLNYRLIVEEAIKVEALATKHETYLHYTERFLGAIEKQIRQTPDQWFWSHKRWSRPKGTVMH